MGTPPPDAARPRAAELGASQIQTPGSGRIGHNATPANDCPAACLPPCSWATCPVPVAVALVELVDSLPAIEHRSAARFAEAA